MANPRAGWAVEKVQTELLLRRPRRLAGGDVAGPQPSSRRTGGREAVKAERGHTWARRGAGGSEHLALVW